MARTRSASSRPARTGKVAPGTDRHLLYQRAVQCVEAEIDFVDETFTALRGRKARLLREDFCGTMNTSCEWVRRRPTNIAVGVDLDHATLAWGLTHNIAALKDSQRARLFVHQGNVLDPVPPPPPPFSARARGFDVVLAMNFSFWCFTQRSTMLDYFRTVRKSLGRDGIFFLDFYGGSDALKEMREKRKIPRAKKGDEGFGADGSHYNGPFTYIWEQEKYNPITGELVCHISFKFPDGSSSKRAFSYHWRLWSLPEIREVLIDAGFKRTTVYWEGDDGKGGGDGVFTATEEGDAGASHICYVTAEA